MKKNSNCSAVSYQRSAFSFNRQPHARGEENFAWQGIVLMGTDLKPPEKADR